MTELVKHSNPIGKAESLEVWRQRMRMPVPTAAGQILDLWIVTIYETTTINGLPLDLLVDAQKTKNDPVKQFGVFFSESPPDWSKYGIPVLWCSEGVPGVGRWNLGQVS
jgi:hypothetical protein